MATAIERRWPYKLSEEGVVSRGYGVDNFVSKLEGPWWAREGFLRYWGGHALVTLRHCAVADTPRGVVVVSAGRLHILGGLTFLAGWDAASGRCLWRKIQKNTIFRLYGGADQRLVHLHSTTRSGTKLRGWLCALTGGCDWYTEDSSRSDGIINEVRCTQGACARCVTYVYHDGYLRQYRDGEPVWAVDVTPEVVAITAAVAPTPILQLIRDGGSRLILCQMFESAASQMVAMYAESSGVFLGTHRLDRAPVRVRQACVQRHAGAADLACIWVPPAHELARHEVEAVAEAVVAVDELPCGPEALGLVRAVLVGFVGEDARLTALQYGGCTAYAF